MYICICIHTYTNTYVYIVDKTIVKILTVSLDLGCGGERNFNIPKIEDLSFEINSIFVSRFIRHYTVKLENIPIVLYRGYNNVYAHYGDTPTHKEIENFTKIIQKHTCLT